MQESKNISSVYAITLTLMSSNLLLKSERERKFKSLIMYSLKIKNEKRTHYGTPLLIGVILPAVLFSLRYAL